MLLDGGVRAAHAVHQDHRVGHLVQVHADRRLHEEADAGGAAAAGLSEFQIPAQVGGDEVRSVRYPARGAREGRISRLDINTN